MATLDNVYVLIVAFVLAICMIVGLTLWNSISSVSIIFENNTHTQTIKSNADGFYNNVDLLYVLAFFGLHIGILVLAFALRSHPVVFIGCILVTIILAIISVPLSNTYETLINTTTFSYAQSHLTITSYIMSKLPMIEVVFSMITIIVLLGLARQEQTGGGL